MVVGLKLGRMRETRAEAPIPRVRERAKGGRKERKRDLKRKSGQRTNCSLGQNLTWEAVVCSSLLVVSGSVSDYERRTHWYTTHGDSARQACQG